VNSLELQLAQRLDLEEPVLREAYPNASINRAANAVILLGHHLPAGWSHDVTDVAFGFPPNYPSGCPDNVCVRADLTLANGQPAGNNQGIQTLAGRQWLQLSWHIEGADWAPTAEPRQGSNLATYLVGALARFEEPT
jgi:hypothetical protein